LRTASCWRRARIFRPRSCRDRKKPCRYARSARENRSMRHLGDPPQWTVDKIVAVRSLRKPQNAPIRYRCARRARNERCK
jgi:hypothetical protein